MAVKAAATITVAMERDISSVTRFYRIAPSSGTPAQPSGTADPTGWSKTEPAYDGTSANSLYITDRTIFTDGTAGWSEVSKSSSYEASREAYSEAQDARKTATDFLTESTASGLMVHPSSDSTTGWKISDALELLVSGASHIWAGLQNAVALVRIGLATAGNVILSGDGYVDVRNGSTVMAHFGYGQGNADTGKANAPYYSLGVRTAGSAIGNYSVAEGYGVTASGYLSHAEGRGSSASGRGAHAEGGSSVSGQGPVASGDYSHAEGTHTTASSYGAHAEGVDSTASHQGTHAQNVGTIAAKWAQTAIGKYNVQDPNSVTDPVSYYDRGKYAFIIGNGASLSSRSNAFTVGWDGAVDCSGGYQVNGRALLTVGAVTADNKSIAKSSAGTGTISATKTGYTPIAVVGLNLDNASSSGTGVASCVPLAFYLNSSGAYYQVRNTNSSSAAKIKITAYVLYMAA